MHNFKIFGNQYTRDIRKSYQIYFKRKDTRNNLCQFEQNLISSGIFFLCVNIHMHTQATTQYYYITTVCTHIIPFIIWSLLFIIWSLYLFLSNISITYRSNLCNNLTWGWERCFTEYCGLYFGIHYIHKYIALRSSVCKPPHTLPEIIINRHVMLGLIIYSAGASTTFKCVL